MTLKQQLFVKYYLETLNATKAAMKVYYTDKRSVAAQIGYENLRKPDIQMYIKDILNSAGLTVDLCIKNLLAISNSKPKRISADTKLRASIELAKLLGMYSK
jgi:phage terminase small subunit